ncbi:MAG: hypothetical protein A3K08_01760 [Candidatus Doudnabacteria bacterium RIFCSPLOWO2_01_41_7]|nr:MAG: hypothetical protein A3K08_01760 [Candidatus Doudnabacteria bacterium RIFCSPLOWO2_01_41_7]
MLTHRIHENRRGLGNAQSLYFQDSSDRFSVGIVAPGRYPFKKQPAQSIKVVRGALEINGINFTPESGPCIIEGGQNATVVATQPSAYICEGD